MSVEKEIERAIKKVAALDRSFPPKSDAEQEQIIFSVKKAFADSTFHFANCKSLTLNQNGKKRLVKQYGDLYSPENILCQSIKQILDRAFKVEYPNRNKTTRSLFSILAATIQMSDFTIVKFDFKDYFNSVSSIYVFEKYLKDHLSDRHEIDLVKDFVYSTKYAYAGLCTSNAIAEIIAEYFDKVVREVFFSNGLIYYERYIDDSILILNEHMEEVEVRDKLENILTNVFHDEAIKVLKCHTKFNRKKFKYISRRKILNGCCSVDFLGYEFFFSMTSTGKRKIQIKYGITEEKRKKYMGRIDKLISLYTDPTSLDYNNVELLRHRIAAFSSREVYMTKHFHSTVWRVKGFISNYGELRYFLDTGLIEASTDRYLINMIGDAFVRAGIDKPYFLMGGDQLTCGYNLCGNMKRNKTILLVEGIGYDYKSLVSLCKKVGIDNMDFDGNFLSYDRLVREYLLKLQVGY